MRTESMQSAFWLSMKPMPPMSAAKLNTRSTPRTASAQLLRALAFRALGRGAGAEDALRQADELIERQRAPSSPERGRLGGFWFDWVNVELLRAEFGGERPKG